MKYKILIKNILLATAVLLLAASCSDRDTGARGEAENQSEVELGFVPGQQFEQETAGGTVTLAYGEDEWSFYTTGRINPFETDLTIELDGVAYKRGDQVQKLLEDGWECSYTSDSLIPPSSKAAYFIQVFTKEGKQVSIHIMNVMDEETLLGDCYIGGFGFYSEMGPGNFVVEGVDAATADIIQVCEAFSGLDYHDNTDGTIGCSAWIRDSSFDLSFFSATFAGEDSGEGRKPGTLEQFDITWDFERLQADYRV